MSKSPSALAWALLLLLGVIWGSSFMLTNIAVRDVPPMTLAALRLVCAALFLLVVAFATGARAPRRGVTWAVVVWAALLGTVLPFWLISWAQQHIASAMTGLLMAPMPLLSLLLARIFLAGEPMGWPRIMGFAAGLGGVLLLVGPKALAGEESDLALLGQLASIGAMLLYTATGIVLTRAGPTDPAGMAAAIMSLSALVSLPLAFLLEEPNLPEITIESWALIGALGLGATALAQILMLRIIALAGPPFFSTVNYQVPLWSAFFGAVILGEALAPAFWAALAMILAGLALAQWGARRR